MEETVIVVARHGETDWNREGRFQGQLDPPLNELGRMQAEALAEELARGRQFDAVYASDLRRASETAAIVARRLGLEVRARSDLREVDVGSWSGLTRDEIHERFPDGFERWQRGDVAHDGETREAFTRRIGDAVVAIAAEHPASRLLLVAHGGVVRSLQRLVLGDPEPVLANGATWQCAYLRGRLVPVD